MPITHAAYGLGLRCSFALPGMPAATADGLPSLSLELVTPAELQSAWSGPAGGQPEWTGRLGDGCELTIERGVRDDVLFSYADRARFRLDASRERLDCAPLRSGLHWQQALLGRILPNVAIMRGYEALHAAAVDSPQGVVAVAAPSGMGKTTLALELLGRGWPLFADDVLTFGDGPDGALAHPGTPHMNVAAGVAAGLVLAPAQPGVTSAEDGVVPAQIGATLGILAGEHWIAVTETAREARPVRMVCLLERRSGLHLEGRVLPAGPLPLAPYMLGLVGDAERERRRFARYADLMGGAELMRLTCGPTDRPADLADLVEQTLAERPALAVGGAR
jgi:hypothetical protein